MTSNIILARFIDSVSVVDTEPIVFIPVKQPVQALIIYSPSPPTNPTSNILWWDTTNGKLKVYYVDQDSSQWVDA